MCTKRNQVCLSSRIYISFVVILVIGCTAGRGPKHDRCQLVHCIDTVRVGMVESVPLKDQ